MKTKHTILFIILIAIFSFTGCPVLDGFIDQNLQGEIQHIPYSFVSGYAGTAFSDPSEWTIYLYDTAPQPGLEPYDDGSYPSGLCCYFTISKDAPPRLYEVGTFGIGADIGVYGTVGTTTITAFDKGEVEILTIDTTSGELSGRIWVDVNSSSEGSSLNGNFSVVIDPASIQEK